jgi:hypothetical protein
MNRDDVLRMAREAGFVCHRDEYLFGEMLERFAALVAAHEREECAKVCDCMGMYYNILMGIKCAEAIRERGK